MNNRKSSDKSGQATNTSHAELRGAGISRRDAERRLKMTNRRGPPNGGHTSAKGLWSCGESNPGPRAPCQVFSGCSLWVAFSHPRGSTQTRPRQAQPTRCPSCPVGMCMRLSLLDDAWIRAGDGYSVRRFDHRSGGESEGTALSVGSYWFPAIVYEMTLAPRPASPGSNVPSRNRSAPLSFQRLQPGNRTTLQSPAGIPHSVYPVIPLSLRPTSTSASRLAVRSAMVLRLSHDFLPLATPISTLARPLRK